MAIIITIYDSYFGYNYIYTAQNYTLMFLEETGINNGSVTPCDDCSSDSIDISDTPFPFGNYRHDSVHVREYNCIQHWEYKQGTQKREVIIFTIIIMITSNNKKTQKYEI